LTLATAIMIHREHRTPRIARILKSASEAFLGECPAFSETRKQCVFDSVPLTVLRVRKSHLHRD